MLSCIIYISSLVITLQMLSKCLCWLKFNQFAVTSKGHLFHVHPSFYLGYMLGNNTNSVQDAKLRNISLCSGPGGTLRKTSNLAKLYNPNAPCVEHLPP